MVACARRDAKKFAARVKKLWQQREHREKMLAYANSERNPWRGDKMKEMRSRNIAKLATRGWGTMLNGGNGRKPPEAQRALWAALGRGWVMEHPVPTKRPSPYPSCYKIDIAHPKKMIAVEVDGNSHGSALAKKRDTKKDKLLRSLGWVVIRVRNRDVMGELSSTLKRIRATTSRADS